METSQLNQWFSDKEIKAICWTLIHSLWLGLIIALLCGIIIATTRKSTAALRYKLLCGLLVLFVCAVGVTYYLESGSAPTSPVSAAAPATVVKAQHNIVMSHVAGPQNQTLLNNVETFLNQNTSIIFLVWLLFFVLKSLKMISGLLYIQRIRNYKTHPVTEELKHRIEHLSSQIGIRRVIRLMQSELVKVPVAVGWLKPMILLPLGITFQLTAEQLDGILWHELAHIRRRDYLVNILQGLVETVFFFNPGLLWLSSLIRTEREACCDDMVLSRMNRKANYLEALLSFGYGEFDQARYAMSIGSGNQLRDRLKRIINQENKRLSVAEKSVLAVGLVLLSAFTTITKDNPVVKHLTAKFSSKSAKVTSNTMPVSMRRLLEGQRLNDSKPGAGKKDTIVTDTAIRFTSVLFKNSDADPANSDIRAMDDKGYKYHFVTVNDKIESMEINDEKVSDNKLPDYTYMLRYIERELAEKRRFRANEFAKSNAIKAARANDTTTKKQYRHLDLDSSKAAVQLPQKSAQARLPKSMSPELRAEKFAAMQQRMREVSVSYATQLKRAQDVITDLVIAKVVPNATAVIWFGLTETELIVNGQKQSNELRERLVSKYGIHKDYGLFYGPVQMTGTGVFIDAADKPKRLTRPPRPKYMGSVMPNIQDSIGWKNQRLIEQQELFAARENQKREQIIKQQQLFVTEQNEKRAQIIKQQQLLLAEQAGKFKERQQAIKVEQWKTGKDKFFKSKMALPDVFYSITNDLVSANVLKDKSDLIKFNLTNSALIVNGTRQSEELHQQLKTKYLQQPSYGVKPDIADDPNFGLHFNAQTGGMGLGVTDGPDSP